MLHPVAFLARRIFLALLIIYGTKYFIWQVTQLMLSTMLFMIITFATRAIESKVDLRLDIFADVCIHAISVFFLEYNKAENV